MVLVVKGDGGAGGEDDARAGSMSCGEWSSRADWIGESLGKKERKAESFIDAERKESLPPTRSSQPRWDIMRRGEQVKMDPWPIDASKGASESREKHNHPAEWPDSR